MYNFYNDFLCRLRSRIPKFLRIMKLVTVLIFGAIIQVSAKSFAQTVTLQKKDISLKGVFKEIRKQTGYDVLYQPNVVNDHALIHADFERTPLNEVLTDCLQGQSLTFTIEDKTIIIRKQPVQLELIAPADTTITLEGWVIDKDGGVLPDVSIRIKGTNQGTMTNAQGKFTLANLDKDALLDISMVGYKSMEIKVNGRKYLTAELAKSTSSLDALEVIAYGTTTKRFDVGSVSTIDASIIEKQPVMDPLLTLEGHIPGLAVNAMNGVPGSNTLVQVRGQNTITSDPTAVGSASFKPYDQPLIIIDGVPFAPQNDIISQLSNLALNQSFGGGIDQPSSMSALESINPQDIASISVLKDADATSIYGTQGSNGVILITTKRGKPGETTFNFNYNTGFNTPAREVKLMNTQQYLQMRKDAFAADGITPSSNPTDPGYAPDLTIFDQNKYIDWQKIIFGKTSSNTNIHLSVSGGTTYSTFLLSGGYTRSNYNFPGNFADQRYSLHSAYHYTSSNNRFTLDFTFDYSYNQNNSPGFGGAQGVILPPNTPDLLDPSGNLVWNYKGVDMNQYQFYRYLKEPADLKDYNMLNSLQLNYRIMKGLSFAVNLGYSRNNNNEYSENPAAAQSPLYVNRSATFATNNYETINIEPHLNYSAYIGKGLLTALLGGTYKKNTNSSNQITGSGYANDNLLGSIDGAPTTFIYDNSSLYKYDAVFGRLRYIYNQKYILSLTGRRDGSSNFGPDKRFGNFGSIAGGWIFSEEKGFKAAIPFISFGKLSTSFGTSGSDGVAPYNYQAFWRPVAYISAFQGVFPNSPQNLYNPDYSWALKKSLNVALDLGFFHDRLLLNATFYQDREGSQLGGYPLPIQAGFSSVVENLPAVVQNRGWEFSLTSHNIKGNNFNWTTNFNITFNRNKLLSFPNLAGSPYIDQYIVGQPVSILLGYRYAGVNPATGLFQYYDQKGNLTSNPAYGVAEQGGDMVPIGNREVKYMGGFGNTFTYKKLSLYVFFQFSSQMAPNYLYAVYSNNFPGLQASNEPAAIVNQYWTHPGDKGPLQRLFSSYSSTDAFNAAYSFSQSSGAYSNDTYARLKTISLSYSLPDSWLKGLHLQDCRIYVNAQNLLTLTNYKVGDPETFSDFTTFPIQRIVAFGLNFNF